MRLCSHPNAVCHAAFSTFRSGAAIGVLNLENYIRRDEKSDLEMEDSAQTVLYRNLPSWMLA